MRISRVYYEGPLNNGTEVKLPEETSHYLQRVLRLQKGAKIILFNGQGGEYSSEIMAISKKHVDVTVLKFHHRNDQPTVNIHLAQAISKGEKMDWIIQKAVELGVAKITPILTEHGNVRLDKEKGEKKCSHWQKIIISACEQSGRTTLPTLGSVMTFSQFIVTSQSGLDIFCDPKARTSLSSLELKGNNITILIGPEGGLSPLEIKAACEANFTGISLGPRILRTETAAIAALAILQHHFGDLT